MTSAPVNIPAGADSSADAAGRSAAGSPATCAEEDGGRQRKRGAELEQAIRDATIAELACCGYGSLTIESVAARAQTGKASIYRRWPTKQELVFDSVCCLLSGPLMTVSALQLGEDVTTRDALLALATQAARSMTGELGAAMRSVMSESLRDPEFAATFQDNFHDPRKALLNEVLSRGVRRGEVRPDWMSGLLIDILAGALIHRYLVRRQLPVEAELAEFIDGFVMPAIRPAG
ncbi:MAG TPA: TetR/AcrR family transcriptional regulator [Jatrophihabitans sp.]|nr:TetR/AcrR family transcriptional regulator [Jatrophihabitans sp.]